MQKYLLGTYLIPWLPVPEPTNLDSHFFTDDLICAPRDIFENVTKVALNGLITGCQK